MDKSFYDPCNRLKSQVYSRKNPGYTAFLSLPLRLDWLEWPVVLLTSQSYIDPELVKVKTTIGYLRSGL